MSGSIEGMASSRPIVATAVGDVPTIVLHQRTGLLVAPENVEELSAAILQLLQHPEERLQLGQTARRFVEEHFSSRNMAEHYLRIYKSLQPGSKSSVPTNLSQPAQPAGRSQ